MKKHVRHEGSNVTFLKAKAHYVRRLDFEWGKRKHQQINDMII